MPSAPVQTRPLWWASTDQEVQPLGIDEAHVANGLDGGLFCAELLDAGQCPDVALAVGAHGAVLRVLLKDLLEIRHIVVNVVFQIEDDTLICVAQQIAVGKISSKNKIRQGIGVGHIQGDFIAPLVGLDGGPVDVHIGLLFQTLERLCGCSARIRCPQGSWSYR